jgi:hypothetical protein
MDPSLGEHLTGQADEMLVVGEHDHLESVGHLVQYLQGGADPVVVEGREDVVNGKRQSPVLVGVSFQGGRP